MTEDFNEEAVHSSVEIRGPWTLDEDLKNVIGPFLLEQLELQYEMPEREDDHFFNYMFNAAMFRKMIEQDEIEDGTVFLALEDEQLVGFIAMGTPSKLPRELPEEWKQEWQDVWDKGQLALDESMMAVAWKHQGKGIGTQLVEQMLNHYQEKGITHFTINTLNPAIEAIFKKLGAKIETPPKSKYATRIIVLPE